MTHLKPVEILERAKEFLQCAEYALRNAVQYHFIPPKAKKVRRMVNHSKEFIRKTKERLK